MAAASSRVFIDTNVLIYAKLGQSPYHQPAADTLRQLVSEGAALWISRQTLREYLAGMTRPNTLSAAIPIAALLADVRYFAATFSVAEDGPSVTDELLDLLDRIPCGGKQIHDANIVATMLAYHLPVVLTHNVDDFKRFAHLIEVRPLLDR